MLFSSIVHADTGAASFTQKIRQFIHRDPAGYFIHIEDMLGEGPGYFDSNPRYLPGEMNCTTWYQTAIATGLASTPPEVSAVLDKIRYYKGVVGYSTRVHFTDNAVSLKKSLLSPVHFDGYKTVHKSVRPDYAYFKKMHQYTCPLYEEKNLTSEIDYYTAQDFLKGAAKLSDGVYLLYPVASDHYIELFGEESGPMGLVHGILLDVNSKLPGLDRWTISHASVTRRTVVTKPLETYVTSPAARNFLGYTLWKINPDWNGDTASPEDMKEIQPLLDCEKGGKK